MGGKQERGQLFEDINPASAQLTHRIVIAGMIKRRGYNRREL